MKRLTALATPFWIGGTVLAFVGVALARTVSPLLDGRWRGASLVGGELLALAGLLIIAIGIRRRVRTDAMRT
jgi:hypothetical protein